MILIHQIFIYADYVDLIGVDIGRIDRNADVLLSVCKGICLAILRE